MHVSNLISVDPPKRLGISTVMAVVVACCLITDGLRAADDEAATQDSGIPQLDKIDQEIRAVWADYQIQGSTPATDGEWCRRLHLDILGRVPTVDELKAFVSSKDEQKQSKLVSLLLYDDKYTEEYARNWTTIWTNILIGRSGGTERGTLTSRAGMQKYLRDTFARNKPYDRMVHDLVTAKGTNNPGSENFNGAVNFLAMKVNEDKGALATAATAKIFLGLQVQCTQCHNHPFNDWKQRKFWEMNAFFRQTRMLRTFVEGTRDIESAELVSEDFGGEGGNPEEAETYFELRNGLLKVAYPVFVSGEEIGKSGFVEDVDRRGELGDLIIKSPYLAKTVVNRYWAHFLGYGFTKPIDDMGSHNAPTHPALLDYMAEQLREQSYDLKELIRWIALSEAYSLSSRVTSANSQDDPLLGESPKFSHFYVRQMRVEELYESLIVATQAHKTQGSYEEQEKTKADWLQQFTVAFGNDEGGEMTTFNGTITQALMMFNGDLVKEATSKGKGSFLNQIANDSEMRNSAKINYLFQSGLGRNASSQENNIANRLLVARRGDAEAAMQDLWWAILNSNEFILNH